MALHPSFPESPFEVLDPEIRWFPADESPRDTSMEKLMPPLVVELRRKVKEFRDSGYTNASDTSRALLKWWFQTPHLLEKPSGVREPFRYFFAQREALETLVYLYDVAGARDKHDLMRYDSSGLVSGSMFSENWLRLVIKMATGSGKTKVMSLAIAWSYFHKLYEPDSGLSRNFLLIAPNIIVLDRLYRDFKDLRIFWQDPVIPDNGYEGQNWRDDFQLVLHKQDDVHVTRRTGNIFLTNIQRVYSGDEALPSAADENTMDYFLGSRPVVATNQSLVDLGVVVRDVNELMILNDEAHHVHDEKLAWFKSIQDIHNKMLQKGFGLSLQLDVTATPKHNNGAIFVQTICDYPLVEAIRQNVVKHPVLPDAASRSKLAEAQSAKFTEKYADYLNLGVIEWRKAYEVHKKMDKKAVLFVMTDDTRNCDDVAEFLEKNYSDLKGAVLVIHTKNNGDISEAATGKGKEELERLRKQSDEIDGWDSPYKAIVSVLMLKEGWDVRNVTTIVGLRAYSAKSNILPEQTLGRGLRKMYFGSDEEKVSVIGTDAFMEFVESIEAEGVELERKSMGEGTAPQAPIVIEVDKDNTTKNLDDLDISIPSLTPRTYREYKNLADIDIANLGHKKVEYKQFTEEEQKEIVFWDIVKDEISHKTILDTAGIADASSVIGYYANTIMQKMRLFGCYDVLYGKIKQFVRDELFTNEVDLDDPNTIRNLSELEPTRTVIQSFKKAINELTVRDRGDAQIKDSIKLRKTRPFVVKQQDSFIPKKSVFNRIVGDSHLEILFASFLDSCPDVISYAKNYFAVNFKIDYVNADGDISNYYPDFIVKLEGGKKIVIVETKGLEDLDVPLKMERLKTWCKDVNSLQSDTIFDYVFVEEATFKMFRPKNFAEIMQSFTKYKD